MKKLLLIFIILGINAAGILVLVPQSPLNLEKQTIYIALAGPMSGESKENGEAMLRGAEMYLDKIKENGRFKNKNIELLVYNDKNKRTAISIASRIADEGKALLVIGHYDSEGSISAGTVYQKNGIPAITASATAESVTLNNDWYFRIVPDNNFMKSFIAYSLKNLLNTNSASIIYNNNDYGTSLAEGFEAEAANLEINIKNKWNFNSDNENFEHALNNIVGDLRAVEKPGTIVCATYGTEGVKLFTSCRYPGTDYPVIGPDSFSTPAFIEQFNNYKHEQTTPGYYTDGIYAVAPFISYLADEEHERIFRQEFISKYGQEPSWVAACYYDAMQVAFDAVEKAEIQGQDIREDRRRVRKALAGINERDIAVRGITGDIFFDKDGNFTRPMVLGFWYRHKFFPAYLQYQKVLPDSDKTNEAGIKDSKQQIADNKETKKDVIEIQGQAMTYLNAVYAGIDIEEITEINMEKGSFSADFYIWFSFAGHFDETHIKFTNAVNPVKLGTPVLTKTVNNISTRAYHVSADFKIDYDTNAYPLDTQKLSISIRHEDLPREDLIYIPDVTEPALTRKNGSDENGTDKNHAKKQTKLIPGWDTRDISYSQDIIKIAETEKQSVSYSLFNTHIQIQRHGKIFLLLKLLFPLIIIVIFLYFAILIPPDLPGIRMLIFIPIILIILGIHLWYGYILPGQDCLKYIFSGIYILTILSALLSGMIHIMHKLSSSEKYRFLPVFGKILFLFTALAASGFWVYSYWPLLVS